MHAETTSQCAPPALLTSKLIRELYLPIGERTFWRWVSAGQFPPADISITGKAKFWKRETVELWIESHGKGVTR